jgi:uncharacterized protein (DUF58 family)
MNRLRQLPDETPDARQFELAARRLADALSFGQERSPFLGAGIEFVQSRPYLPGDPVRFIDWRVTARTGRVHVKEYEAPRQLPVYLLIDTSASMCVSSQPTSKYAWAVRLAGGLALAALDHMNPVGVLAVGGRALRQEPSLSRGRVLQALLQLRLHRGDEPTAVGRHLRQLLPRLERRCLLVLLSDLHDPDALPALKLAAQDHDVIVLRLEDPAERGLVAPGLFRAVEAETGRAFAVRGGRPWAGDDVARDLGRAGIDALTLSTDAPVLPRVRAFVRNRGVRRR